MNKFLLIAAAIQGAISVLIGAFGAHGLKNYLLSVQKLEVFETAVKYQFYHTFALLAVGMLTIYKPSTILNYSGYSFIVGTIIFSGSLYILCLTNISRYGAITPIGGLLLVVGWALLAYSISKF